MTQQALKFISFEQSMNTITTKNVNAVYEIPKTTKNAMKNMYELGVTQPKRIRNQLMLKNIELPDKTKLERFLRGLKTEKLGPSSISLVELKKWLEENSEVPVDKHRKFSCVVG